MTEPDDIEYPTMSCPLCSAESTDLDGFGFFACLICGYCTHPSRTGGKCEICGEQEDR